VALSEDSCSTLHTWEMQFSLFLKHNVSASILSTCDGSERAKTRYAVRVLNADRVLSGP